MIARRDFLLALGLTPIVSNSFGENTQIGPVGPNYIPRKAWVDSPVHIPQDCPNFCWAASIAMIFAKHGHPIAQEDIVAQTFGGLVCKGAPNTLTIANDLSQSWVDKNGVPFTSTVTAAYDPTNHIVAIDNDVVIEELSNNRPLLICNTHHAMVLTVVDYLETPMGNSVKAGAVLDPWPLSPKWHYLDPVEFTPIHLGGQMMFLATVDVS